MVVGLAFGKLLPNLTTTLSKLEFGQGSQVNVPIGILLWLIPRPIRDLGYRCIASIRYKLFGKLDACRRPSPAERARFLD